MISQIKSKNWTNILCSVDTVIYRSNDVLSVILYNVSNPSGSVKLTVYYSIILEALSISPINWNPPGSFYIVVVF
ncbi:MAG: hypothetical protein JWR23_1831 [Mucilaginibacter sp.]|nr:hypothetical protein [Mucilaginibacter sp.]